MTAFSYKAPQFLAFLLISLLMPSHALASERVLTGLDFQRTLHDSSRLILEFSEPAPIPEATQVRQGLLLRLVGTEIREDLQNTYDTSDFATLVTSVHLEQRGRIAEIQLDAKAEYSYMINQSGNLLMIELTPPPVRAAETASGPRFRYTGEKISLNYQDIPVRQLLGQLAEFLGLNLVASDNVTGNITLNLNETPSDQALDIILTTKGLASRQQGNVLLVAPATQLVTLEKELIDAQQSAEVRAPLEDAFIRINYARAVDIHRFILGDQSASSTPLASFPGTSTQGSLSSLSATRRFLSDRGHLLVDDRTNTLYVRDIPEQIGRVRDIVRTLDVPVEQVMIEARIVLARTGVSNDLGVSWGLGSPQGRSGNFDVSNPALNQTGNRGLAIDFSRGNDNRSAGIGFGYVNNNVLLDLELAALEASNRSEVISQPRVVTSDRTAAVIRSGQEIPYVTVNANGERETSFRQAELRLEVVPNIVHNGQMVLELKVNNDSRGDPTPTGELTIDTNAIETQVLVNDGQTLVIGGIFTSVQEQEQWKTPFFGDIPLIGWLFRRSFSRNEKVELMVFITPRLINDTTLARN